VDRLSGKAALVTGGASGLGAAICRAFVAEGARVAVADLNRVGAEALAGELNAGRADAAIAVAMDVTEAADWARALGEVEAAFGGLSVLVNNAGRASGMRNVEEETFESWRGVQSVFLDSVFLGCKLALPLLARSAPASIINMSSMYGLIASDGTPAYNAAKAGVWLLTKSVALHCAKAKNDVRCNSIHPAFIRTPALEAVYDDMGGRAAAEAAFARGIPLGRLGDPEEVAPAAVFLASDESQFVTASEIKVDGGATAW